MPPIEVKPWLYLAVGGFPPSIAGARLVQVKPARSKEYRSPKIASGNTIKDNNYCEQEKRNTVREAERDR